MEYRPLGRTGISVSQLCLGAMMFGAFGNPDHDESIAIVHRALDAGDQLHRHRRLLFLRRVGGDRRQGARRRPPRRRRPRHQGRPAGRRGPEPQRWLAALDRRVGRAQPAPARHRLDRPPTRCTGSIRPPTSTRRSARCRTSSTRARSARSAPRTCPPRRSSRRSGRPSAAGASASAPSSRPTRCSPVAIEYDVLPTARRHGLGVLTYSPLNGGWLSGRYRKGQEIAGPQSPARAQKFADRYDLDSPANAAKFDAADALGALADEAGITLVQMAISFVTRHPAVTSAIVGPRTIEHLDSYLERRRGRPRRRRPRPHRRDRRPRRHRQRRGRRDVELAGPRARGASPLTPKEAAMA